MGDECDKYYYLKVVPLNDGSTNCILVVGGTPVVRFNAKHRIIRIGNMYRGGIYYRNDAYYTCEVDITATSSGEKITIPALNPDRIFCMTCSESLNHNFCDFLRKLYIDLYLYRLHYGCFCGICLRDTSDLRLDIGKEINSMAEKFKPQPMVKKACRD